MYQTLKTLLPAVPSISGREKPIRDLLCDLMRPFVDEISTDAMGNLICRRKGRATAPRKVLLCAHMDEIGFLTTFIEECGMIRVAPMGGVSYLAASYAQVVFENGTKGVLVPDGDHVSGEVPKPEKCVIDIGAASKKEAERRVRVGDCCALVPHTTRLSAHRVCGRPLDDRIGCACLVKIAKHFAECIDPPADDVYYVFSVQEEVGSRGARPAAFGIAPDLALNFDVTGAGDIPGAKSVTVKLGGGAAVKIRDSSVICHTGLVEELLRTAKREKIPAQCEIKIRGGTDTSAVQMAGAGCRAGALSIPCRYVHTGAELLDLRDAEAAVSLAVAYLEGKRV